MDERPWVWNSPPGWPLPPPGWTPPAGWSPPPEWPPPPPGWQFWVRPGEGGPVPLPFGTAGGPAPYPYGAPGGPVPHPYGWAGQATARRSTNGLAVASLVLSIVWLAGVGSILAIVFGVVARRQIRESKGAQGGEGVALAGFVIGILGVIGLGAVVLLLVVLLTPRTVDLHYGQTAVFNTVSAPNVEGIASMSVETVTSPATSSNPAVQPLPGGELVVAGVQLCANGAGTRSQSPTFELDLLLPRGRVVAPYLDARSPSLNDVSNLGPHRCALGYVTYAIPMGQAVQGIRYHTVVPNRSWVWKP